MHTVGSRKVEEFDDLFLEDDYRSPALIPLYKPFIAWTVADGGGRWSTVVFKIPMCEF